jgi:hypothetical protein
MDPLPLPLPLSFLFPLPLSSSSSLSWQLWQLPGRRSYDALLAAIGQLYAALPHRVGHHGYRDLHCPYHYVRIFSPWVETFTIVGNEDGDYSVKLTGDPFNDAYRYVDWLLTATLLIIEHDSLPLHCLHSIGRPR